MLFSRPFVLHLSPDTKDKTHLPPPLYPGVHGHGVVLGALAKLNPMAAGEQFVGCLRARFCVIDRLLCSESCTQPDDSF